MQEQHPQRVVHRRFDVRQTLHPFLERLNAELQETVHVGVLDGTTVRFVDALESPRAVRVASRLGQSMPAHCTSPGKALLAQLPDDELRRRYPDEELQQLTPNSVATRAELEREVELARRLGYATSSEESEEGVGSVAVALSAQHAPMQVAFNVSVPISRMNHADQRRISAVLRDVAEEAAEVLH